MGKYRVETDNGAYMVETDDSQSVPGMEQLGGAPPPAAAPPKPVALTPPKQGMTRVMSINGKAKDFPSNQISTGTVEGAQRVVNGVIRGSRGTGRDIAGGTSDVIRGTAQVAGPMIIPSAVNAPVRTAVSLLAGAGAQKATEAGLKAAGVPDEYSDLASDVVGIGAGVATAKASDPFKADPRVALNRSLRPVPSDSNFSKNVPTTLARVLKANEGKVPGGITDGELDVVPATQKAIDTHKAEFGKWMDRAKGVEVPGDSIVKATADSMATTDMLEQPQAAKAVLQEARQAYGGRRFTVDQMRQILKEKNASLDSFYDKSTGKQLSDTIAGKSQAIVKAQRDAIADALYRALDPQNEGAGPREIQQSMGNLIDVRNAALRRQNAIIAEQPLTPFGKLADPVKGFIRSVMPGKATGAGIAYAEGSEGRSLPTLRRAFKAVRDVNVPDLPTPDGLYPRGTQLGARLALTQGDVITPPPSDTSGVRSVPAMPQPPNPRRALPPASTFISPKYAPPDAASMRGAPPVTTLPPAMDGSYVRGVPAEIARRLLLENEEK